MRRLGLAPLLVVFVIAGCTRVIDTAGPQAQPPPAPITGGQVSDLLSEKAMEEEDSNLFVTVEPAECAGLAAEVDPPFIFDTAPAAHAGGGYFDGDYSLTEMVGVYSSDFDPKAAIDDVKRTIESCQQETLITTAMEGQVLDFRVLPASDSGSPDIVLWSVDSGGWACDDAFIAAHNAAIEITACGEVNGYDMGSRAREALQRIEDLANTMA